MASRKSILASETEETGTESPRRRSSRIANAPVTVKPAAPVGRRRSSASEAASSPAPAKIALTKRPSLSHEIQIASPRAKRSESKSPSQELPATTTRRASLSKAAELEAKTRPASPATILKRRSLRGQSTSPTREEDTPVKTRGRRGSLSQASQLEAIVETDALPKKRGRPKSTVEEPKREERTQVRRSMRLRSGSVDAPEETEDTSKIPLTMSAINEEENEPVKPETNDSEDKNGTDEVNNDVIKNNDDTADVQELEKPPKGAVLEESKDTEVVEIDKAETTKPEKDDETEDSKVADNSNEISRSHLNTEEINEKESHTENNMEQLLKVDTEPSMETPELSEDKKNDDVLSADELELHIEDDKPESPNISAEKLSNSNDDEEHSKELNSEHNNKVAIIDLSKSIIDLEELKPVVRRSPRLSASPSRSNSPNTRSPLRSSPRIAKMRSDSCESNKTAAEDVDVAKSGSIEPDKTSPMKPGTVTDSIAVTPEKVEPMDIDETPEDVFTSPIRSPHVKLQRKSLSFSHRDSDNKCEENKESLNETPKSASSARKASLGSTPKRATPKSASSLNESVDAGTKDEFASDGSSFHLNISIPQSTDSESVGDKSRVETALNSSGSSAHSDKENSTTKLNTPRSASKRTSLSKASTPVNNVIVMAQTEISKESTPLKSLNDSNIIEIDEVTECGTSPLKRPKHKEMLSTKVQLSDDEMDILQEDAMMCSFVDELLNENDSNDVCAKPVTTSVKTPEKLKENNIDDNHALKKVVEDENGKDEDVVIIVEEQPSKSHENESKKTPKKLAISPLKKLAKLQSPAAKTTDFIAFNSDTDSNVVKSSMAECTESKNETKKSQGESAEVKHDDSKSVAAGCTEDKDDVEKSHAACTDDEGDDASENKNDDKKAQAECSETTKVSNIDEKSPIKNTGTTEDSKIVTECFDTTEDNNDDNKSESECTETTKDDNVDIKSESDCTDKKNTPQKNKVECPEAKVYTDSRGSKRRKLCRLSMDKSLDDLISRKMMQAFSSDDESDDDYGPTNEYIDDQAMEGEEDTPSEGSNEIIDEGESLHSSESENDEDEDYEQDSFIDDDESVELLSGNEFDLDDDISPPQKTKKKRSRIIAIPSSSDDNDDGIDVQEDKKENDSKDKQYKVKILQDIPIVSPPTAKEENKPAVTKVDDTTEVQSIFENKKTTSSPEKEVRRTSINYQDKIKISEIHEKDIGSKITNMVEFIVDQVKNKDGAQVSLNVSLDVANPLSPGDSPLRPIRSPGCKRPATENEGDSIDTDKTNDSQSTTKKGKRLSISNKDSIISFSDGELISPNTKQQRAQLSHSLLEFPEGKKHKKSCKSRLSLGNEYEIFSAERQNVVISQTQPKTESTTDDVQDWEVPHAVKISKNESQELSKAVTRMEDVKKTKKKLTNKTSEVDDIDANNLITTEEVSPIKQKNKSKKTQKKLVTDKSDAKEFTDIIPIHNELIEEVSSPLKKRKITKAKHSPSRAMLSSSDFDITAEVAPRKIPKLKKTLAVNKGGKEDSTTISGLSRGQIKKNKQSKLDVESSTSKISFTKQDVHTRVTKTKEHSSYLNDMVVEIEKNPQASMREVQHAVPKPKLQKKKKAKLLKPSSTSACDDWDIQGTAVAKPSKKNKVKTQVEKLRSKFAPNDFKNRMLYDSNIARMVSADILKNKKNGKYV